jgi:hypothetical protein
MSELMRNPDMMAKAQAEVRQMLVNRSPQDHENHMDGLRYMRMVIKDTMRPGCRRGGAGCRSPQRIKRDGD